jgi:hypothetical protein
MAGVGMALPLEPGRVQTYLGRLKDAALNLRLLHARFNADAAKAVGSEDMDAAFGR